MAEPSRQPFRFRLPWMISPISNLTRPSAENQRATQPTATIPVQRKIRAPTVPLPPQPQPPPPPPPPSKDEPKPPSPARSGPQSGMASKPQTQSRAASQPPSPSRTTPPSQVASLPPSPPRTTPSQPPQATQKTESQPPPPSQTISQTPLPSQTTPSQSQAPQRMESETALSSQASPRTTPQSQASSEPQSPSRTITSQTQAPPKESKPASQAPQRMESETALSSQASPQTTPQSQASSEPQSPSRTITSQSQAPPKKESKPASPSPAAPQTIPQSKATSEPPSPSRTTPSQPKTSPRTESKPATPPPAALQSGVSSQPPSPSRASKTQSSTRTVSQPLSPSPTNTQRLPASRVPSKPSSPTRLASQTATRTPPQSPSSSSRITPKVATIQTTSQPPSPSRQVSGSQIKTQASSQPSSPSKSSISKPKPSSDKTAKAEPTISHPLSQDAHSQVPATQSQNQQLQAASEHVEDKRQTSQVLSPAVVMSTLTAAPPEVPAAQSLKSSVVPIDPKKHPNLEAKTKETKEEKPKPESSRHEDKPMTLVNEEPKQRKSTDIFNIVAGPNKQGRSSSTSQGKHNHLNKQVHGDNKDVEQESKTTTTTPQKVMNASSESQPRPPVSQGEQATLHKEIKESIFGVIHKLGAGHTTQGMDGPVSVITLTGENRGASMHVGAELARKEGSVHIHRGYKLDQDEKNEMTTDGESSSKRKSSNPITKEDEASTAYINSNVQSINNSIMSNSSMSERSPGVRWVLEHNQKEPVKTGNQKSVEAHKADFNVTHSQKLTYEPTIRRRCLRGLLLEPSESDPDNPEKPRRHGCRYSCDAKKKCKDNGKEGTTIQ